LRDEARLNLLFYMEDQDEICQPDGQKTPTRGPSLTPSFRASGLTSGPFSHTSHRTSFPSGRDIPPASVEQAIKLSGTKYCSAMASLNTNFEHSYRIVEDEV
jgi:hypothetical protein